MSAREECFTETNFTKVSSWLLFFVGIVKDTNIRRRLHLKQTEQLMLEMAAVLVFIQAFNLKLNKLLRSYVRQKNATFNAHTIQ